MSNPYPFDLGAYVWPVSTSNADAQRWFDRGVNWLYAFNHEEAVTCFKRAVACDPKLGMGWWGIAYAAGPFYNMPWRVFTDDEAQQATAVCFQAAQKALTCLDGASDMEAALISAIAQRYQKPEKVSLAEFDRWDAAYGDAMRTVYANFGENPDVVALTAEALMTLTPWRLWDVHTGKPAKGAATLEALTLLENAIKQAEDAGRTPHAAQLHLHIHVLEMSDTPEAALGSADRLLGLCPDGGHLQHMPGHIYVLCGLYAEAIACSEKAITADRKYLAAFGVQNFYTTSRCHDLHLMMYAAMMAGRLQPALQAAAEIRETLPPSVLRTDKNHMAITLEGYFATQMHVLVRFGRWQDILDAPLPPDPELYVVSTAMHYYGRGVAHANLKQIDAAERAQAHFQQCLRDLPADRLYFNNQASDILAVANFMLAGELAYHKGNYAAAFEHLREAARRDDTLFYTEPWAWMHPPRHALGALLLQQNHVAEAETAYRADLGYDQTLPRCCRHPENVWALHGLAECLHRLGKAAEHAIVSQRLALAQARTDTPVRSSCCCRTG